MKATDAAVNSVLGQVLEVVRLMRNGTRSVEKVRPALQSIIEGGATQPSNGLIHGRFARPETQVAWVKCWNKKRNWGFTDGEFNQLGEPPVWPMDNPLAAVILTPYLNDVCQTYDELWQVGTTQQPSSFHRPLWSEEEEYGEWAALELMPGLTHTRKLVWEVVDLGYGVTSETATYGYLKRPTNPAHAAILAAAALHPEWVRQMREEVGEAGVPFVALAGYRADRGKYHEPNWDLMPVLGWGNRAQSMVLEYTGSLFNTAMPVHLPAA